MSSRKKPQSSPAAEPIEVSVARLVAEGLRDLRFGMITVTIHDGRVTEVSTTSKTRLPP